MKRLTGNEQKLWDRTASLALAGLLADPSVNCANTTRTRFFKELAKDATSAATALIKRRRHELR